MLSKTSSWQVNSLIAVLNIDVISVAVRNWLAIVIEPVPEVRSIAVAGSPSAKTVVVPDAVEVSVAVAEPERQRRSPTWIALESQRGVVSVA